MSKNRFGLLNENDFENGGFENMGEIEVRKLEQQALGPFRQSFNQHYEQWKMGGLLIIALETMPKQVKKDEVSDRLLQLWFDREKNLNEET
jgi:hypothetical protein